MKKNIQILDGQLEGSIKTDALSRALYATDASVYKKTPLAVSFPKSISDLKKSFISLKSIVWVSFLELQELLLQDNALEMELWLMCPNISVTLSHWT